MQTTFRLKEDDLSKFAAMMKALFKKEKEVEVTITAKEMKEEYFEKLKRRLKNLDEGKGVEYSGEEFVQMVAESRAKYRKKK